MFVKPVAIVTNATEYAGPGSVEGLIKEGFQLVCHDPSLAKATERYKGLAECSISAAATPEMLVTETLNQYGRLDALISNDIASLPTGSIEETDPEELRSAFEKLTVTPFRLCAAAVPVMKRQRRGHIVLVTSGAGRTNPVTASADRIVRSSYVVSREATNTLVRCMALELAPFGVQVNAVAPYLLYSQTFFPSPLGPEDPKFHDYLHSRTPMGRFGREDEIGALISFLASGRATFVSGQIIAFSGAGA